MQSPVPNAKIKNSHTFNEWKTYRKFWIQPGFIAS